MIASLIAWGIGFGGVNYIPTLGLAPAIAVIDIPGCITLSPFALNGGHAVLSDVPYGGAVVDDIRCG